MLTTKKPIEKDYLCNFISDIIVIANQKNENYSKVINILNKLNNKITDYYQIDISFDHIFDILNYSIDYIRNNNIIDLYNLKDYIYKNLLTEYSTDEIRFKNEIYKDLNYIFELVNEKISTSRKKFDSIDSEYLYISQIDFMNKIQKIYNNMVVSNFTKSNYDDQIKDAIISYKKELDFVNKPSESIIIDSNFDKILVQLEDKPKDYRPIEIFKSWNVIHSKRLGIFMAPTGYGKSHLLCHIASDYIMNAPQDPDYNKNIIFYFSFENTKEETLIRILSNISDIPMNNLLEEENKRIAIEKLKNFTDKNNLVICELPPKLYGGISSEVIERYIEDFMSNSKERNKIYAIIVDYLDLMSSSNSIKKGALKWETLGEITIELKSLAMKLNTAVITATQTNREGEIIAQNKQTLNRTNVAESYEKIKNADILIGFLTAPVKMEMYNESFTKAGKFFIMKHRYSQDGIVIPFYADFRRSKFFTKEILENNSKIKNYQIDDDKKVHIDPIEKKDDDKKLAPDEGLDSLDPIINELLSIKD